ncbi:MAG TPA: RNA polymerase sigma factor [Pyrinomonadaceae bacterium]|jgi:RNA polymerase sigma-70 factor (ECF subfamily)|nr:RNA polymerase sigma factor [Pyrinomonadaceae bacterium]
MSQAATIEAHEFTVASEKRLPENISTQIPESLARLIERAAAGDMVAFEEIMKHSEKRVMRMTWRMLGNEADARDAAQEVFLRVYKYLGRFKQDQPFFAWVYQITLNVCRDIARKRQQYNTQFISLDNGNEAASVISDTQADAEETLIRVQERELMLRAIATLPERERAAILLRDIEGFSTDEVAHIMRSSATTVRSQISSARQKIRVYCGRYLKKREERRCDEL